MKLYKVCILFTCLFMKRHDKHLHTSPLTIPFLIKSSSSSPAHRLGRPLHPSPWTQSRGGTSTGTQSERVRERVCSSQHAVATHVQPSQLLRHNPSMPATKRAAGRKKQGCRIYLKRSGEHVSKAGWDLVFLSLSVCPFCYHSVETWEAGQALQSEHRGSPPVQSGKRAQWEHVCAWCRTSSLCLRTDAGFPTAPAGRSESRRAIALAWTDLRAVESPREQNCTMERPEHMLSHWARAIRPACPAALEESTTGRVHEFDTRVTSETHNWTSASDN